MERNVSSGHHAGEWRTNPQRSSADQSCRAEWTSANTTPRKSFQVQNQDHEAGTRARI
jgi:hypothetical protein